VLKLFVDWLIIPPADFVAYLVCIPLGFGPLIATYFTSYHVVEIWDRAKDGRAKRTTTFIIAGILSLYVLVVTGAAIARLPHVLHTMGQESDE